MKLEVEKKAEEIVLGMKINSIYFLEKADLKLFKKVEDQGDEVWNLRRNKG